MNIEQDITRIKMGAMWGCLIWAFILILGPIILFAGFFYYSTKIKERTLIVSHSPDNISTIEVVEKGEPFFFSPSLIRLKYNEDDLFTSISNDGKRLDESNVEINWKDDKEATIVLYGEEQVPEVISFKLGDNNFPLFKVEYIELGYIPTPSTQSPFGEYAIQIRRSTYSKGSKQRYNIYAPIRVYYGPKDKEPKQYKEWDINGLSMWDYFELNWSDDNVVINALSENDNGTTYVKDSLEISFN